jgi:hypothetical protein
VRLKMPVLTGRTIVRADAAAVQLDNGQAFERVLGVPVYGWAPVALHYLMCLYRMPGLRRRGQLISELAQPPHVQTPV